jgi:outer membrane immunogenic protein
MSLGEEDMRFVTMGAAAALLVAAGPVLAQTPLVAAPSSPTTQPQPAQPVPAQPLPAPPAADPAQPTSDIVGPLAGPVTPPQSPSPLSADSSSPTTEPPPALDPSYAGSTDLGDTWSGFFVGGNAGISAGDSSMSLSPTGCFLALTCGTQVNNSSRTFHSTLGGSSVNVGAEAGYNWMVAPNILLGVAADIGYDGLRATYRGQTLLLTPAGTPAGGFGERSVSQSMDFLGTVRGRIGFTPATNWLIYATGGLAYGDPSSTTNATFAAGDNYVGRSSGTRIGWTAGAGLEWALSPFWSIKAEYLYVDLGSRTYSDVITNGAAFGVTATSPQPSFQTRLTSAQHIIRLGVDYRFGAPPPPPPPPPVVAEAAPPPAAPKVFIVFFDWDKDTITPEGQQVIQQAADAWKSGAPVQLQVTGYTDRSGSPGYNQRLSERRANNVARALNALGVPREDMIVAGRGENDNRVPTAPGVREPQNRRVEIVAP